ncbi:hypothetical protein HO173_008441 [Letharia columbiana]|uniref:Protein kinase domain-containing protein n=1 Tax=Letharia columbiana TaxID=112416 RepID=A0A8H6FRC3_9LECA|nr:uncharacterized protein HO173_008441 [Letharia columbiana]KAF6233317.1 hypothetical protein HO173_008441 [Letharia columbiana]
MSDDSATIADLRAQLEVAREKEHAAKAAALAAKEKEHASTGNTSLAEYLALYQEYFAYPLHCEPMSSRNTRGGVTSPLKRLTPTTVEPWTEFEDLQRRSYQELCEKLGNRELFPDKANLIGARGTVSSFLITSKEAITTYVRAAEIPPVKEIVCQYIQSGGGGEQSSLGVRYTPGGDPESAAGKVFVPVDGVWNRGGPGSDRPIALAELKPPHKLTTGALRTALDDGNGKARKSFESQPIIQSPHARNDPLYTVLAVFTQVFDEMISSGTEFAYVDTGMARVFFRIRRTESTVLYYSLDVSPREVIADARSTAVCQIALFLCRCLTVEKFDQNWIAEARASNSRFEVDPEAQLDMLASQDSSASEVITPSEDDYEPARNAPKKRKRANRHERDLLLHHGEHDSEDDGDNDDSSLNRQQPGVRLHAKATESEAQHSTTSPSTTSSDRRRQNAGHSFLSDQKTDEPCPPHACCVFCPASESGQPYCTQVCLQRLTNSTASGLSRALDRTCPNVDRHSLSSPDHELSAETLCDLLRHQLRRSRDHAMDHLKIRGGIGHLFRVTLCSYGYTFVAKAVREDHLRSLTREYAIYGKLRQLQAEFIPVCLGLIELETPYVLPFPDILTHLLLLSYSGPDLLSSEGPSLQPEELRSSAEATLKKLQINGLQHGDVRKGNMLWNTERSRVFMLDFESSEFPGVPAAPPSPRVIGTPPKRMRTAAIDRVIGQASSSSQRKKQRADEEKRKKILNDADFAGLRQEIQ